jgi:hypothetical protein
MRAQSLTGINRSTLAAVAIYERNLLIVVVLKSAGEFRRS